MAKKKSNSKRGKKKIKQSVALLIIGILAIASIFIITIIGKESIQSDVVYPSWSYPYERSNVPYEKIRNYQFCHEDECIMNCEKPFPDRKCVYNAKGTTANCPLFTNYETGVSWQPHWKCE